MMRGDTQIMLFIAHLPWDCDILTGMVTGTQGMWIPLDFTFFPTCLLLSGYLNILPSIALLRFFPTGIIIEIFPQNVKIKNSVIEV